jgi:ribonuclease HIII
MCIKDSVLKTRFFYKKPLFTILFYQSRGYLLQIKTFHVVHTQILHHKLKTLDMLHMELSLCSKQALCIYNPLYTVVAHGTKALCIKKTAKQAHW